MGGADGKAETAFEETLLAGVYTASLVSEVLELMTMTEESLSCSVVETLSVFSLVAASDLGAGELLCSFLDLLESRCNTTSSTEGNKSLMASSVTSEDKFLSTATLSVHLSVGVS